MAKKIRSPALPAKAPTEALCWMILDTDGRIVAVADPPYHCGDGEVQLPLPPAAEGTDLLDWRYREGAWVNDPLPPEVPPEACVRWEVVIELLMDIQMLCVEMMAALDEWRAGQDAG